MCKNSPEVFIHHDRVVVVDVFFGVCEPERVGGWGLVFLGFVIPA